MSVDACNCLERQRAPLADTAVALGFKPEFGTLGQLLRGLNVRMEMPLVSIGFCLERPRGGLITDPEAEGVEGGARGLHDADVHFGVWCDDAAP